MTSYTRQIKAAQRQIDKAGAECTYISSGEQTRDPSLPWRGAGRDDTPYTVKAVVFPSKPGPGFSAQGEVSGPIGMHKALIAGASLPDDFTVKESDRLIDAKGQLWKVQKGWTLAPDGANILFTLELQA